MPENLITMMETFFGAAMGKILQCCPNLLSHVISVHSLCDSVLSCSATQLADSGTSRQVVTMLLQRKLVKSERMSWFGIAHWFKHKSVK